MRVVDIGNNINVGVGILQRESTLTDEGEGITTLSHRNITEVYYVLSGLGILETAGDGETMTNSADDIVVIPSEVLHGFRKILDQITYLSIRFDTDQVFPA